MKIQLLSIFLLFCLAACKEEMDNNLETEVITVNITGAEQYEYKIADAVPTEGGYSIRRQAKNYQISSLEWGTYSYKAKQGFKGTDRVEIVLSTSIGNQEFSDKKRWVFEITVE